MVALGLRRIWVLPMIQPCRPKWTAFVTPPKGPRTSRSSVTLLKAARLPAPNLILGRILEVVANAGLFNRGMTLVGTAAYQTYAPILGYYLPTATYATNDVICRLRSLFRAKTRKTFIRSSRGPTNPLSRSGATATSCPRHFVRPMGLLLNY